MLGTIRARPKSSIIIVIPNSELSSSFSGITDGLEGISDLCSCDDPFSSLRVLDELVKIRPATSLLSDPLGRLGFFGDIIEHPPELFNIFPKISPRIKVVISKKRHFTPESIIKNLLPFPDIIPPVLADNVNASLRSTTFKNINGKKVYIEKVENDKVCADLILGNEDSKTAYLGMKYDHGKLYLAILLDIASPKDVLSRLSVANVKLKKVSKESLLAVLSKFLKAKT
jgi:hypothetical protein